MHPALRNYAVMVIVSMFGYGGYELIDWSKLDTSDWAEWTGSIGTVCTLIGTIYIATSESRHRHKEAEELGIVTAAYLLGKIYAVGATIDSAIQNFNSKHWLMDATNFKYLAADLRNLPLWKADEMIPLLVFGRNYASDLASICSDIPSVIKGLERMEYNFRDEPTKDKFLFHMKDLLVEIRVKLLNAQDLCEDVTKHTSLDQAS